MKKIQSSKIRLATIVFLSVGIFFVLLYRLYTLQVQDKDFLQMQGEIRSLRSVSIQSFRGMIFDRNGEPLAISTPVKSLWVNPSQVDLSQKAWRKLAKFIQRDEKRIKSKIKRKKGKQFAYLKRQISPQLAKKISKLNLKGLYLKTEYKRFYPMGEVFSHVLGTTNLDHKGIQGLELVLDKTLSGSVGQQKVLKDRYGKNVGESEYKSMAKNGKNITLSLDSRIQYLAYKSLKQAVAKHRATAGIAIVLDVKTGEILAMVNEPTYNPNTRFEIIDSRFRNRAVTDTFEPGSVMKAFSMVNVLQSGKYYPHTSVDTSPGWLKVGGAVVKDFRNYGKLDLSHIMQKSSNVGITKLTLALPPGSLYQTLKQVGFGEETQSTLPGEVTGSLNPKVMDRPFTRATLAFGYGMTVTPLQLAQSYAILGDQGRRHPTTFLKQSEQVQSEQVIKPTIVQAVNKMLQLTTQEGGTGIRARVPGYIVAGKTGTVRKVSQQGYDNNHHVAVFAGFVPANRPKVAIVVFIDDPSQGGYYGGVVAAPVFSRIAQGTMRILNIPQQTYDPSEYILAKK
jgi:cell division protein FtsI (penicillin-binding protein 3)